MKNIVITGLNGVIGRVLYAELPSNTRIIDLYHNRPYKESAKIQNHVHLDLLEKKTISNALKNANPDIIIHMAAITHIDACEEDKKNGKEGIVWKTNVEGSEEIAKYCAENKIPLIFISTECVFDGKQESFDENSKKNPINWYGISKSEAEDRILSTGASVAIIRSVVAYHMEDDNKTIYGKLLQELQKKNKISVVHDQLFTPTYTFDIVQAIKIVMEKSLSGIFHVAPVKSLSPYDFAKLLAKKHSLPFSLIKKTTLVSLYGSQRAALRLSNASLLGIKTNKILKFTPKDPELVFSLKKSKKNNKKDITA